MIYVCLSVCLSASIHQTKLQLVFVHCWLWRQSNYEIVSPAVLKGGDGHRSKSSSTWTNWDSVLIIATDDHIYRSRGRIITSDVYLYNGLHRNCSNRATPRYLWRQDNKIRTGWRSDGLATGRPGDWTVQQPDGPATGWSEVLTTAPDLGSL